MEIIVTLIIGLVVGLALGSLVGWLLRSRRDAASGGGDAAGAEARFAELADLKSRSAAAEATAAALREQIGAAREQLVEARAQTDAQLLEARARVIEMREQSDGQLVQAREQHENTLLSTREQFAERLRQQEALFREQLSTQDAQYREQILQQEERLTEFQARLHDVQQAEAERVKADGKVLVALSPVQESLRLVQAKVTELEEQRRQQHGELSQQLKSATESEERLRNTAESLASALRSNSTRGVWGETQLRNVVEAAGLLDRVDFETQSSLTSDNGAGRPDMVVHLPGGKNIAVDAKVPFNAYLEASQIPATATGAEGARRTELLKAHVKAVRDHITTLGTKGYWAGLDASPELVVAFIPSESLISTAMEADPSIMDFAFSKRVALVSPVTLWSLLKTVAFSWQQDVLTHEAKTLFDLSKELYSRLAVTATHIDKLGSTLDRTVKHYNAFIGSFERNVYSTARKLSSLDESIVLKPLEPVEENARSLTAPELVAQLELEDDLGSVGDMSEQPRLI
ncbi:DNA recombination protein RmuC [Subtercola frigoramans]|uniref:DNA recombination protein RmuC n=1 Tax=Subtercola frigoramans TaxID=120298 RepID=A0ABS2L3L9_9MICO|nr:DNA recombination protein RmuC [Subtercola frigoramans]MBM7471702.1 DNA recombination protein RmuC [Subtercola frigoramans]